MEIRYLSGGNRVGKTIIGLIEDLINLGASDEVIEEVIRQWNGDGLYEDNEDEI